MKTKKVLVVNNDMDTMSLIQQLLQKKGYEVKYSGNAAEVMELIQQFKPDLLLIDILQTGILQRIPKGIFISKPRVLMMTGYNNQFDHPVIAPDAYIKKPFSLKQLEEKIAQLI